ncbi:prephenate dehydratase [Halalkalibacterium ligniniphilum]|uniref:prephenate dehydratase n=1 Tax=Halalkalibacterium ligniniphilum TaxID=1134413 RepID=UPI0003495EB6|nr:prephenate dehydratase [Halalkalibacterium ligniniphilum]
MRIGYLGPKGTFTEMAAASLFAKEELVPYQTIPNCMDAAAIGEVDFAVVPVENAIEGSVNVTLDYLIHKKRLPIIGDIVIPIAQHFLVHPSQEKDWLGVEKVISHPHAIAQCHDFLRSQFPNVEIEYMNSTGAAAEWVMKHPEQKVAAIANSLAASSYQLLTVKENIHDYDNNRTRFVVLSKEQQVLEEVGASYIGDKTTMMVTLPSDYSGALHQVLSAFAWRKLNLSKIESRPMKTGLGNYFFIIDVDQRADDVLIPGVTAELEALGCGVELLGSYPCFSYREITEKQTTLT